MRGRPLWAARRMPWSACSCFGGVGLHSTRAARSGSPETSGGWLPGYWFPPPNFVHLECLLIVLIILCTKSISMFIYLILKSSFIEWFLLSKETLNCRETSFINSLKLSRNFIKLCCQLLSKYNLTQFFTYSTNMFSNWLNCMHGMIVIVYLGTSRTQITEDLGTNNIITSSKHCTQYASKIQYFPFHFTYSNRSRRHRRILEQHSFSTVK